MSDERVFVDTNVLLYAHDRDAGARNARARAVLSELWRRRTGVTSSQVFQEFAVNATRKPRSPLDRVEVRRVLEAYLAWPLHVVEPPDVFAALDVQQRNRLSFWDALVVVAARRLGAARICTEDLDHGQRLEGIEIVDPFRADPW